MSGLVGWRVIFNNNEHGIYASGLDLPRTYNEVRVRGGVEQVGSGTPLYYILSSPDVIVTHNISRLDSFYISCDGECGSV